MRLRLNRALQAWHRTGDSMLLWLILPPVLLQAAPTSPSTPTSGSGVQAPATHTRTVHLEEAVQRARQNQPTILQAKASTDAAEGRREQARAGLLPQVTATALYEKIHGSASGRTTSTTTPGAGGAGGTAAGGAVTPTPAAATATTYDFWSFGAS